jgi:CTD small phosphatase-like protein 2
VDDIELIPMLKVREILYSRDNPALMREMPSYFS